MSIDVAEAPATLADILARIEALGGVPPGRVLMHPFPGTATERDLLALAEAPRKVLCELVDGTLVEKVMGYRESVLALFLGKLLIDFVRPRNLGLVSGEQGIARLFPGLIRIPDVAFASWDRLPGRRVPTEPIPELVPDLTVEILSPSNTVAEMKRKRREYFAAGVRLDWEIDPDARTVSVYTAPQDPQVLTETDTLTGGDVLPGFTVNLRDLFAELDLHG